MGSVTRLDDVEPRVLLDATAVPVGRGGVGRYVDCLVSALDADGARLSVVCQHRDAVTYAELAPHSRVIPVAGPVGTRTARLSWEQRELPRLAARLAADVLHSPHYTTPLALPLRRTGSPPRPVSSVVTLHDATFFTAAQLHAPVKAGFFRAWTRISLQRATRCLVPSTATADELVDVAGARRDRLSVVPHGVEPGQFRVPAAEEVAATRAKLGVAPAEQIVTFLGALEPRKNVPSLIRGFGEVAARRAARGEPDAVLVLAGQQGWDTEVDAALAAMPHRVRIVRAGYLPVERLPGLLGGSAVVAYPSLGEGFGLPVLEAMACGACVLTSGRLSLPEVGGDAVAYTGTDAAGITRELDALLSDPARRAALGAAARRRAKDFSWQISARGHMDCYAMAVRQNRRR